MKERYFYRTNRYGQIEQLSYETGEVVRSEEPSGVVDMNNLVRIETDNGPIYTPKGIIPPDGKYRRYTYNRFLAERICDELMEGDTTLTRICRQEGYPSYSVVARWMIERPEFAEAIRAAREARAERYHDQIIDIIEEVNEDTAKADKVKIDALKWAAEKGNPQRYGNKVQVTTEKTVSITVNTGFSEVEAAIEAEAREV